MSSDRSEVTCLSIKESRNRQGGRRRISAAKIGFSFCGMTGIFWQQSTVCRGATIFDK
jgi:hypothetical protein